MKIKHNKKRNVGLLFAQLSQAVSESLVEGDEKRANELLKLIKKHYRPSTELFREFRLFRAIMVTEVSSPNIATSIISEAKKASRAINKESLRKQKSALIKDINYSINEAGFYDRRVEDYKAFATIQTLLKEWRADSPDIGVVSKFESELFGHLLKSKQSANVEDLKTEDVNQLAVDIMRKKIQEKFGKELSQEQVSLLKEYTFSEDTTELLAAKLEKIKNEALAAVTDYSLSCENNMINDQIPAVIESINSLTSENINDETISRYLSLLKITEDLASGGTINE
jgi:hypothetical protein